MARRCSASRSRPRARRCTPTCGCTASRASRRRSTAPGRARCCESNAKRADEHLALEDLRRATKVVARTLFDLLQLSRRAPHECLTRFPWCAGRAQNLHVRATARRTITRLGATMHFLSFTRRRGLAALAAALTAGALPAAQAQETTIKFQLDWRFEGPAALFLVPVAKGYFKAEKLNVTVDAGNGSGGTVTRVASGTYDMGFADLAALMEFHANNPTAPNKPVAVMMVYNNTPAAVLALKKSGIKTPGRPERQEARRAGVRRRPQGLPDLRQGQQRQQRGLDRDGPAAARDHAGARRHRRHHRLLVHLAAQPRGARREGRGRSSCCPTRSYGVKLYGNVIIVGEDFLKKNPEAVKASCGLQQGHEGRDRRPEGRHRHGQGARRHHQRGARTAPPEAGLDATVLTPDAKAEGFGNALAPRLSLMASQVSDAFATKERINPTAVWNGTPAAERGRAQHLRGGEEVAAAPADVRSAQVDGQLEHQRRRCPADWPASRTRA